MRHSALYQQTVLIKLNKFAVEMSIAIQRRQSFEVILAGESLKNLTLFVTIISTVLALIQRKDKWHQKTESQRRKAIDCVQGDV
jgi:hypothetical protein